MKINRKIAVLLFCIITILFADCTSMSKQRRKEKHRHKKNEQLTEERKKEAEKQYEEAMKENYKQQTKATRKRMKQHGNQAQRYNENKKEFFIKRWFTKKRRSKIKKYDLK